MTAFVKLLLLVMNFFLLLDSDKMSEFRKSNSDKSRRFIFCPKITTFLKIKLLVSKTFCQTKCPISDKLSDRFSFGFRQLIALPALYPNAVSGAVNGYKMTLIVNHSDFKVALHGYFAHYAGTVFRIGLAYFSDAQNQIQQFRAIARR